MSKSVLSRRIDVCTSISKLNKDGCRDVIRFFQNMMGLDDLNHFITKIFMDSSNNWTIDQIIKFEDKIKQTLVDKNYCHCDSQSQSQKTESITKKNIQFSLLRLPIDLITQTSLYLNETDIFNFERCCRLFYQMINNTTYLSLSNNFQTFTIRNKTLDQMTQVQCSFFKYSKTKHVQLDCDSLARRRDGQKKIEKRLKQLRSKWEEAKQLQVGINDGWFNNMFKSIETLHLRADGIALLDKLPIESLFDPNESHLNEIIFNHCWNEKYSKQYIDKFETKYLNIQQQLEKQDKHMRPLTRVKHCNLPAGYEGPSYMLVKHLHLSFNVQIDLNKNWLSAHYNPYLRKLSCHHDIKFQNINGNQRNKLDDRDKQKMNIDTLRLKSFDEDSSSDIFNNKIVIETLNLQNSLKNLLVSIDTMDMDDHELAQWQNIIESILKKEHFYKLENVIILLDVSSFDIHDTDWIFKMLQKNAQLLKYQFKQLIIGISDDLHYYVLEWNKNIDAKDLDGKALLNQISEKKEIQMQIKQKYLLLLKKWSS